MNPDLALALSVHCPCPSCRARPGERCSYTRPYGYHVARYRAALRTIRRHGFVRSHCPACLMDSIYFRGFDRYFHADGSDSRPCWARISQGVLD